MFSHADPLNRIDEEQAFQNEIFSDFEAEANSSEEDEGDNSSTSSKGDPELVEVRRPHYTQTIVSLDTPQGL